MTSRKLQGRGKSGIFPKTAAQLGRQSGALWFVRGKLPLPVRNSVRREMSRYWGKRSKGRRGALGPIIIFCWGNKGIGLWDKQKKKWIKHYGPLRKESRGKGSSPFGKKRLRKGRWPLRTLSYL